MAADPIETALRKVKNGGYFFVAVMLVNAGAMWQSNRDFQTSQHAINTQQQILAEQQQAAIADLKAAVTELKAISQGQNRRLEMLENAK